MIRYIKSKKQRILSPVEVKEIINKIETGRLSPSFKTNQEHVIHVQKIKSEKQNGVICPQCGAIMVMRESKNGKSTGKQFWGCSRFPKCRGIVNIT